MAECCYLEHANLSVRDLDEAIAFSRTAVPHLRIRGCGRTSDCPWDGEPT